MPSKSILIPLLPGREFNKLMALVINVCCAVELAQKVEWLANKVAQKCTLTLLLIAAVTAALLAHAKDPFVLLPVVGLTE